MSCRLHLIAVALALVPVLGVHSASPAGGPETRARSAATNDRFFVGAWGVTGTNEGQFNSPGGVDTDASGRVFVVDGFNHRIQMFDRNGNFIRTWGWGVQDGSNLFQICPGGCQAGIAGDGAGQMNGPSSPAVDSDGNVFVDDSSTEISKFDSGGNFVTSWGSAGTAESQFSNGIRLATDSAGNVYATDLLNHRVQVFDGDGNFLRMWGWGVKTGSAQLEICTSSCQAGISGSGDGQFNVPIDASVDAHGNVYVLDLNNGRVQVFGKDGSFMTSYGGIVAGAQIGPLGVEVALDGTVYVVDNTNHRVLEFGPGGMFLRVWGWGVRDGSNEFQVCMTGCQAGLQGPGNGQLDTPQQIGIDAGGFIYVADTGNDRIQKFAPAFLWYFIGGVGDGSLPWITGLDQTGESASRRFRTWTPSQYSSTSRRR